MQTLLNAVWTPLERGVRPLVPKRDVVGLLRGLERHGEDNIWRVAQEAREEIEALRGQHDVFVRLLVEADKVLGTIDGESQEEWDMLLQLRRCITAATMPHRPETADLLSIRERLGC